MFGYVLTNCKTLTEEQRKRFRAMYCGMCRTLRQRHGNLERLSLSNDMTFLALLLSALYEPEETVGRERCALHPAKAHDYVTTEYMEYAVDMNIALAYHKCRDNWLDDRNPAFAAAAQLLKKAYQRVSEAWPDKCRVIEEWMTQIVAFEKTGQEAVDIPMNMTGRMLGRLFQYREDVWSDSLYRMGEALGRFIYLMDAYDDLPSDVKHKRFNPLKSMVNQPDYEDVCKEALMMAMADCAEEFERMPIIRDADLIRNVLYSGVWARYGSIQAKKEKANRKGVQ